MQQFREFEVDGARVAASLHVPRSTPAPGVVMCHGFTGHRIEAHFLFVKAARVFCEAGLNVLRFDFRGSGESDGRFRDMTITTQIEDALAAVERMRAEPTVDPERVALLGLSLGGLVAACAAARDADVAALALWSAVADMSAIADAHFDAPPDPDDIDLDACYEHGAHEIGGGFIADALRIRPLREIAQYTAPALVVHGTEDGSVPVQQVQTWMDALTTHDATLRIIDGADHTYATVALERAVATITCDWLRERLT